MLAGMDSASHCVLKDHLLHLTKDNGQQCVSGSDWEQIQPRQFPFEPAHQTAQVRVVSRLTGMTSLVRPISKTHALLCQR